MASLYDRISDGTMSIEEITQAMVTATSEGGKFYQSMEKQSQTLNGQLATLQDNANELLGSITSGLSSEAQNEIIPMVNNMIAQLQSALDTDGITGLIDEATAMLPDLIGMMTGKLDDALDGITKWAPKLANALTSALPTVVNGLSSAVPAITTALFQVASNVLSGLIAMLPELIPALVDGVTQMAVSVVTGITEMASGIEDGIHSALLSLGLIEPTAEEAWEALVKTADSAKAEKIAGEIDADFTLDLDINTDNVKEKVESAKTNIENQLKDVEGIDASTIAEKIIAGKSADVLGDALVAMGIDQDKIDDVVDTIESAQTKISDAIDTLGLTDEQETTIQQMIQDGATANDISEYLMKTCGVDSAEADKVVETITTAQTNISAAIESLNLEKVITDNLTSMVEEGATENEIEEYLKRFDVDEQTAKDIAKSIVSGGTKVSDAIGGLNLGMTAASALTKAAASGDKATIEAALQLMGLDDVDISSVLASYTSVKDTLTSGIASIFTDIEDTLTDGKADTPDKMNGLKEQVEGWAEDAYNQISKWYSDKLAELEKNKKEGSISEETYKQLVQDATDKYDALTQSVNANAEATVAFIEDCAGKTTEYCAGRMEELGILKDEAYNLAAQIDALSLNSQQMSEYSVSRTLTINGRTSDQTTQLEALKLTAAEYEQAKADADQAYAEAVAALQQQYTNGEITEEEYSASESEAAERLAEAYKTAGDAYNEMMTAVIEGIAKANPEFAAQLEKLQSLQQTTDIVENIKNQIANGQNGDKSITAERIIKGLGMDADTLAQQLNEQLGTEFNGETLTKAISDSLKSDPGSDPFAEYWTTLSQDLNTDMTEAMQSLGGEEGFAATLQAATSQGWLAAVNGIDWADLSTQLQTAMNAGMAGYEYTLTVKPEVPEGLDTEGANEEKISAKKSAVVQAGAAEVTVDESVNEQVTEAVQEEVAEAEPAEVEPQITVADTVADLNTQIANALSSGTMMTAQELLDNMDIDPEELVTQINEMLGTDLDVDKLKNNIGYALAGVDSSAMTDLQTNLSAAAEEAMQAGLDDATDGLTVDMSDAVDSASEGAAETADAMDVSSEAKSTGTNVGKGFYNGLSIELDKANIMVQKRMNGIINQMNRTAEVASPSKATRRTGEFLGQGLQIGLEESMAEAVQTAKYMSGKILTATDLSQTTRVNMPSLTQEIKLANDQSSTPVNLDGKQIATIQGHNNSMTIAWNNTRYAKGVGSK